MSSLITNIISPQIDHIPVKKILRFPTGVVSVNTWPTYPGGIFVDGSAAIRFQEIDITPFRGVAGANTPYKIILTDSAGKIIWGYLAEADTALALGSELVTNGTFDANINGWNNGYAVGQGEYNTLEWDAAGKIHAVNTDGSGDYFTSDDNIAVTAGKLYKISWDLVNASGVGVNLYLRQSGAGTNYIESGYKVTGSYALYYIATVTENVVVQLFSSGNTNYTADNISLKEVTHLGADGCLVVSAKNGSTQNWNKDVGFDYNCSAGYTFEIIRA